MLQARFLLAPFEHKIRISHVRVQNKKHLISLDSVLLRPVKPSKSSKWSIVRRNIRPRYKIGKDLRVAKGVTRFGDRVSDRPGQIIFNRIGVIFMEDKLRLTCWIRRCWIKMAHSVAHSEFSCGRVSSFDPTLTRHFQVQRE